MGFRQGSYCTIWEVEPKSDTNTKARISISKKNKDTGEYETDFSGYVSFLGSAAAKKAACLKEKDRIKLGDVDVTTFFNKEKNQSFTSFKVFSFESADGATNNNASGSGEPKTAPVDEGEIEDRLPF